MQAATWKQPGDMAKNESGRRPVMRAKKPAFSKDCAILMVLGSGGAVHLPKLNVEGSNPFARSIGNRQAPLRHALTGAMNGAGLLSPAES
ncbi:MAG: hypothetical protein QGD94_05995 [Planctomycetia bacterium]|nr:hypothetical protein [Planctomycetia bacterium]